MHYALFGLIIALAGMAPAVQAQVFRCATPSGKLTFSDRPCDSGSSGTLVEREKSWQEIARERDVAAQAEERKYRARAAEREQQLFESQMQQSRLQPFAQQQSQSQRQMQSETDSCKAARKELEFISAIRTVSQDEKRMRTNAAISNVNAACGSNTPLMQEPPKIVREAVSITRCDAAACYDNRGRPWHKAGSNLLVGPDKRTCNAVGTGWSCN